MERVKKELASKGLLDRYLEFDCSTATVDQAARAIGCSPGNIAKTLAFITRTGPIIILLAGIARVDNKKFKALFGQKAIFPSSHEVQELVGHPVGGV